MSYCVQLKPSYMLYWDPGLLKCDVCSEAVCVREYSVERAEIIIYYCNCNNNAIKIDWIESSIV